MNEIKAGVTIVKYSYKQKYFLKQKILAWIKVIS